MGSVLWRKCDSLPLSVCRDKAVIVGGCNPRRLFPAVSEWGLIVVSLFALTAGTLVYARRRPAQA